MLTGTLGCLLIYVAFTDSFLHVFTNLSRVDLYVAYAYMLYSKVAFRFARPNTSVVVTPSINRMKVTCNYSIGFLKSSFPDRTNECFEDNE